MKQSQWVVVEAHVTNEYLKHLFGYVHLDALARYSPSPAFAAAQFSAQFPF